MDRAYCIPVDTPIELRGNFQSLSAVTMQIVFEKCIGHDYCETEENINTWLTGKYILTLANE